MEHPTRQVPQRRHHHAQCPGTHTVSERRRRPSSTAAATASGVVASGASGSPAVIRVRTNPGRTTMTCTPVPYSASPRPCANASRPSLAGAVDEVGAAGPLARDGRQHHQRAVPLLLERARADQARGDRAGVVGLRHPYRGPRVPLVARLVAQGAEGEQHHVDVARGEHLAEGVLVVGRVERVEVDGVHLGAERAQLPGRLVEAGEGRPASHTVRVRRAISRRVTASAISDVPPSTSRDWGGRRRPSRQLLRGPGRGGGHRHRRRDRSEVNTPRGSSSARRARKSSSRGYMAASSSGRSRESLAR